MLIAGLATSCGRGTGAPAFTAPGKPVQPATSAGRPTPLDVLERMAARYASAPGYRDTGTWSARAYLDGSVQATYAIEFETTFDRNQGMSLDAKIAVAETGSAYVYSVRTFDFEKFEWDWSRWPGGFRGNTAFNAFEAPIADTLGPVALVPSLLMPAVDFKHLRLSIGQLTSIADAGDEAIAGVVCTVVDANGWCGQQIRLWVDENGGLRRLWGLYRSQPTVLEKPVNAVVETTIDYTPEFDGPLTGDEFAAPKRDRP